ncbi:hypothetical protein MRS44_001318 [Fusarium solani]|uniref:uncharacterized protein n=1 Tax=Fusarium solani TaxID=169388 RepID=UPI0032C3DD3A|nr:hypothetical protein MRS44_001318 [Fusarium solani]
MLNAGAIPEFPEAFPVCAYYDSRSSAICGLAHSQAPKLVLPNRQRTSRYVSPVSVMEPSRKLWRRRFGVGQLKSRPGGTNLPARVDTCQPMDRLAIKHVLGDPVPYLNGQNYMRYIMVSFLNNSCVFNYGSWGLRFIITLLVSTCENDVSPRANGIVRARAK